MRIFLANFLQHLLRMWPIELIPDSDLLFRFVNKVHIKKGKLKPKAFKMRGEGIDKGMSTDWEEYSTPQKTKNRTNVPADNGVISFVTGKLRKETFEVVHTPKKKIGLILRSKEMKKN